MTELLSPRSSYIGQVGSRCYSAQDASGNTITDGMTTTAHFLRDKVSNQLTLVYPNYRYNGTTEANIGPSNFKLGLKMPDNSIILSDQNAGGSAITAPAGNVTFTFTLNNPIPDGSLIMPRISQHCAAGIWWTQLSGGVDSAYGSAPIDGMEIGSTANDKVSSGTIGFANGISYFPTVIAGNTRKGSVIVFGTSREAGEYIHDNTFDNGLTQNVLGKLFGITNVALSGTLLSNWNSGDHTFLNQLISAGYWKVATNEYGVNDVPTFTAAQVATARALFATNLKTSKSDIILIGYTLYPYVGTTDIATTKVNQAIGTNQLRILTLNDAIRLGIAGEDAYWDLADGLDPFRESKFPVDWNSNDASRTPCSFTGSIVGSTLSVTAIASGSLNRGDPVIDPATPVQGPVLMSTWIVDQLTGTAGSTGTYQLNYQYNGSGTYPKPNVSSRTLSTSGFMTLDCLHATWFGRQLINRNKGPDWVNLVNSFMAR